MWWPVDVDFSFLSILSGKLLFSVVSCAAPECPVSHSLPISVSSESLCLLTVSQRMHFCCNFMCTSLTYIGRPV